MAPIKLILMVLAFVLAALAFVGVPSGRFNLLAGAFASFILAQLV